MELQRLSLVLACFVLAVISHCSEARHAVQRRAADDANYDMVNDDAFDTEQNDDGGNETENNVIVKIKTKPEVYHPIIGNAVRLVCELDPANNNSVVVWKKGQSILYMNKMPVMAATYGDRMSMDRGTNNLVIRDLKFGDSDKYTCQVEQDPPVSVTHVVYVEEAPRITSFTASNLSPVEGTSVNFTCEATGNPKPSLVWSRQRKHREATEPLAEANGEFNGSSFLMKEVTKDDSGTYYCYAINAIGNAISHLNLVVEGKPRLFVHKDAINSDINLEAQLSCSTHEGNHYIEWLKDDEPIMFIANDRTYEVRNSRNDDNSNSTLLVRPKSDKDFGTFTCQATNTYGTHRKSIELVQAPIIEHFGNQGSKLTWTVHSHQPLENIEVILKKVGENEKWEAYQVPLPETQSPQYKMIYDLGNDKFDGDYEVAVRAKNTKDWSKPSEPVRVNLESKGPERIVTASVLQTGGGAYTTRPASFVLHAVMMYLLVRMM